MAHWRLIAIKRDGPPQESNESQKENLLHALQENYTIECLEFDWEAPCSMC